MSSVVISGNTSGSVTLSAPAVAGNTVLTLPTASGTLSTGGVGEGQTWQNVGASRAINTNYQNTTGKPIMVHVSMYSSNQLAGFWVSDTATTVQAATFGSSGFTIYGTAAFIIPNGHYYKVTGGSSIGNWWELR